MEKEVTRKGLHLRHIYNGAQKVWQAWNGDTYLAGGVGPMALFAMGAFLDAMSDNRYFQPGKEENPGIKWYIEIE